MSDTAVVGVVHNSFVHTKLSAQACTVIFACGMGWLAILGESGSAHGDGMFDALLNIVIIKYLTFAMQGQRIKRLQKRSVLLYSTSVGSIAMH